MNIFKRITLSLALLAVIILGIAYVHFKQIELDYTYSESFLHSLKEVIEHEKVFNMNDITPFEWDKMYMFGPYTTQREMEEIVGAKWTTASFVGYYTWVQTPFGQYPLDADELHCLIFTKDNKVVHYALLFRSEGDFTTISQVTNRADATFTISENKIIEANK